MTLPAAYFDGDGDPNRLDQPSDHHDKHASWQTDASGNATGLVGPDGANITINNFSKNTIVLFGDSRTLNNNIASMAQFSARSYWSYASQILGGQITVVANTGVVGNTSGEMLARIQTDVWDYAPAFCLMHGCFYNDFSAGTTAATIIAHLTAMFDGNAARGITTVYGLEPGSSNINTAAKKAVLTTVNNAIINYARFAKNFVLVDTWNVWTDPATGNSVAAYSADNIHQNTLGAVALGRAYADALAPFVSHNRYVGNNTGDLHNHHTNGILYGDNASGARGFSNGTGITGTGPDGCVTLRTGTATAVSSKVPRTDFRQGDWWQFAVTGGSDGNYVSFKNSRMGAPTWTSGSKNLGATVAPTVANGCHYVSVTTTYSATGATEPAVWPTTYGDTVVDGSVTWKCVPAWNVGDVVEHSVEFEADSFSGAALLALIVVYYTAGAVVISSAGDGVPYSGDTMPTFKPTSGVLRTPRHAIPAGTVLIDYEVRVVTAAGVTGNVRIANPSFRVVSGASMGVPA